MKQLFFILTISFLFGGCFSSELKKEILVELSNGKMIKVSIERKEIIKSEKVLVVEYKNEEGVLKLETVEKEVLEVWSNVEDEANKIGVEDSVISAGYFIGKGEKSGERKYEEFLFDGEKIENGTWKITKVN